MMGWGWGSMLPKGRDAHKRWWWRNISIFEKNGSSRVLLGWIISSRRAGMLARSRFLGLILNFSFVFL